MHHVKHFSEYHPAEKPKATIGKSGRIRS